MKHLFLATTILGFGFLSTNTMAASSPVITVGGVSNVQAAFLDQEYSPFIEEQDVIFRNDNEIHFSIDGKTQNGLEYGAVIHLEADVGDEVSSYSNADRTYIYLQGKNWGRLEFGSNDFASNVLKLDADSFARGTGGIGGDIQYYLTRSGLQFIRPSSLASSPRGRKQGAQANKITYYTPNFNGFQAGISYTPDYNISGQNIISPLYWENIISVGARYEGTLDDFKFAIAGAFENTKPARVGLDESTGWHIGGNIAYSGFTIGASYADFPTINKDERDSHYWTLGAAYANDQFGVSVSYFESKVSDTSTINFNSELQNLVFSADYNLAPGIMPYAELAIFEIEQENNNLDNEGTLLLIGTEFIF